MWRNALSSHFNFILLHLPRGSEADLKWRGHMHVQNFLNVTNTYESTHLACPSVLRLVSSNECFHAKSNNPFWVLYLLKMPLF